MSALLDPHDANTAQAALLMVGNVKVTRLGGGFGESLMDAAILVSCCKNKHQ